MTKTCNVAVLFALLATAARLFSIIEAAKHELSWIIPTSRTEFSDWAQNRTFVVGDSIVFNFIPGTHSVGRVTQEGYDNCNLATLTDVNATGPVEITLDTDGMDYFICGLPGHCAYGQKLAVNVQVTSDSSPPDSTEAPKTPSGSSPPGSSPSPSGSNTPDDPPPSSASCLVATFSLVFVSAAIALFH